MTREFWLSFAGKGVAIVPVTQADFDRIAPLVKAQFPDAGEQAQWLAAALRLSHEHSCNPGDCQVAAYEMPAGGGDKDTAAAPRFTLMNDFELSWRRLIDKRPQVH